MSVNKVDFESVLGEVGDTGDWLYGLRCEEVARPEIEVDGEVFSTWCAGGLWLGMDAGDIHNDGGRPAVERSPG